jgi:hypothetical protein
MHAESTPELVATWKARQETELGVFVSQLVAEVFRVFCTFAD